jgi:hypothetical protein
LEDVHYDNITLITAERKTQGSFIPNYNFVETPMIRSGKIAGTNFTLYNGVRKLVGETIPNPYDIVATGPTKTLKNTFNDWSPIFETMVPS